MDRACQGATVIEVGTLRGDLALWCCTQRPDIRWTMVDNWLPMDEQPEAYRATGDDHALHPKSIADRNRAAALGVADRIEARVLQGNSVEVANGLMEASADLVFIDADHSYDGCAADIVAWKRVVKLGGWLGGHDYRNPDPRFGGVDRAVDEAFESVEMGANYTWWIRL